MTGSIELLECPLCDFTVLPTDDYVIQLHFEQVHTTDSPFRIEDDPEELPPPLPKRHRSALSTTDTQLTPAPDGKQNTVECPEPDCGEFVLLNDFNEHLDYHAAESLTFDETTGEYHSKNRATMHGSKPSTRHATSSKPSFLEHNVNSELLDTPRRHDDPARKSKKKGRRGRSNTTSSEKSTLSRSIQTFNPFARPDRNIKPPSNNCRLGNLELGPYAWEDSMPTWLHNQLAAGPKISVVNRIGRDGRLIKQESVQNETPGIIPILAQLSALDRSVKEAYYCHPSIVHIGKTPKEGGFCGYRNIQMLISYIQGSKAQGHEVFPGRTPGILKLQDLIERAWDKGINTIGRQQTGGIRDTRKYIGTPEAQALFLSAEIDCGVQMFGDSPDGSIEAHESLLAATERYFTQAAVSDGSNVYKTLLPPVYLQRPGHSITIIGFERRHDGTGNLVVFDPMYSTSPAMHTLIGRKALRSQKPSVLDNYRRGVRQLRKFGAFEILMLTAHPPLFPAWDVLRQFPDLRYVYAFFRSKTLGFDVYPEDHFLRNFPWQQYGGLWIVDDARFARSEELSPLIAQALRRITSEGASTISTDSSKNKSFVTCTSSTSDSFRQIPPPIPHSSSQGCLPQQPSLMSSLDTWLPIWGGLMSDRGDIDFAPVLDMVGMHTDASGMETTPTQRTHVKLSLLTDVGRRYPGYPSALSPTSDAKYLYPSPDSGAGSGFETPRITSPASGLMKSTPASPMKLDSSNMPGQYHCLSTCWASGAEASKKLEYEELLKAGIITDHDMWNNHYQA
ncbi:hypothetical protein PMIN06_012395 [Paraphaeosphaeria minitans]